MSPAATRILQAGPDSHKIARNTSPSPSLVLEVVIDRFSMLSYQIDARKLLLTRNRRFLDGHNMTVDQENIQFSHLRIVRI